MLDIHLTENCGVLDNLLPGGLYLADRGCNNHESAGMLCVEVKMAAFTKGKKQSSQATVNTSRQLNRVHIHGERAIGAV